MPPLLPHRDVRLLRQRFQTSRRVVMTNTVTIGKRLIPLDHIALVEPFDPSAHPGMKTDKAFKARVVLIDRQSVLTEEESAGFAEAHGFRMLAEGGGGTNPAPRSSGETFDPRTEGAH